MQSDAPGAATTLAAPQRLTVNRLVGAVLAAFSILVMWECRAIPIGSMAEPGPGAVPMLLALALLLFSALLLISGNPPTRVSAVQWTERRHAIAILGTCLFVALALERLGYRLTIFAALLVLVGLVEKRGWITGAVFAGIFSLGTYYAFTALLRVPLPLGPFGI